MIVFGIAICFPPGRQEETVRLAFMAQWQCDGSGRRIRFQHTHTHTHVFTTARILVVIIASALLNFLKKLLYKFHVFVQSGHVGFDPDLRWPNSPVSVDPDLGLGTISALSRSTK